MQEDLADLEALPARDRIANGNLRSIDLVEALLARIGKLEPDVGAFAYLNAGLVWKQARKADERPAAGDAGKSLRGVPVAIKDIIDTADMPTENGTPLDAGRRPDRDAVIVQRLRQAGAVIMGKSVTTELASMFPGRTRNPRNLGHTPGGSSSGSAAAVAAGMVPLAIGTQTSGSVIRPASYCGVVGFKPSFGIIPRTGVLGQVRPLDTVGVFARSIVDAALLVDVLAGADPGDPDSRSGPPPRLLESAGTKVKSPPRLAFVRTPVWDLAEEATKTAFVALAKSLGAACVEAELPEAFAGGAEALRVISTAGIGWNYGGYYDRGADRLSPYMRKTITDGRAIAAVDYLAATECQAELAAQLDRFFDQYDAIVTPAATGEAPVGIEATGSPAFCSLWSLCGAPAISLPLLTGPSGLPVGVQLVGRRGDDGRLLGWAHWFAATVSGDGGT